VFGKKNVEAQPRNRGKQQSRGSRIQMRSKNVDTLEAESESTCKEISPTKLGVLRSNGINSSKMG